MPLEPLQHGGLHFRQVFMGGVSIDDTVKRIRFFVQRIHLLKLSLKDFDTCER